MNRPQTRLAAWMRLRIDRRLLEQFLLRNWVLGGIVALVLVSILLAPVLTQQLSLTAGEVAKRDVEASRTVVDQDRTSRLQAEAIERAITEVSHDPMNYVIDGRAAREAGATVTQVFARLREVAGAAGATPSPAVLAQVSQGIARDFGFAVPPEVLRTAYGLPPGQFDRLADATKQLVENAMRSDHITELTLESVRTSLGPAIDRTELTRSHGPLVLALSRGVLRPNVALDPVRLERAKRSAVRSVEPIRILKGQTIIRKGDVVTMENLRVLQALGMQRSETSFPQTAGTVLVVFLLLWTIGAYLHEFMPETMADQNLMALLSLILILMAFTAKLLAALPWLGAAFLIPVAFGTMLVTILLEPRLAIMVAVVLALFVGLVSDHDLRPVVVALAGGLSGIFSVSKVSQRSDLIRAGFIVGGVSLTAMLGLGLFLGDQGMMRESWLGLVNGIVSSVLAIGSLAYFEMMFGITSSIRLLELSNPNHPLLKRLLVEASGTYHHSIMVGNLAEAAAEAIHADPLLARVGAYYHDIGKIRRPIFFSENQRGGENPHDKIAPALSTLIITTHVKDGVELAKEAKLPAVVVDFIRMHHGTDLVRYFYHRAVENDQESGKESGLTEKDFRYPGPKPQSKEIAIVMLADSVEAAIRGLQKPTPGRVEGMVRKLIKDRLSDGQFDESNLTLRDLDAVAGAFVRVLSGMFHRRVEYPEKLLKEFEQRKG